MHRSVRTSLSAAGLAALVAGVLAATPATADTTEYLSSATTQWSYLDNGVDPGDPDNVFAWTVPGYDDSAWKTAKGSFGSLQGEHVDVGGNAVTTHLTQYYEGTSTNHEAFFFRTSFAVDADALSEIESLRGTVRFDDALSVWVNGEKVAGFIDEDFDPALGNLQYLGVGNSSPIVREVLIPADALVAGENTVAVALYQDRDTSSDIYFDFESLVPQAAASELAPGQYIASDVTEWTYHDRDADPAGSGDTFSWTQAGFDSSGWSMDRAPFGALRGEMRDVSGFPVRTLLQQYKPGTSTNIEAFFFRTSFELTAADLDDIAMLMGTVRHDDALAVWINGEKIAGVLDEDFDADQGNMQYLGASGGAPELSTVIADQSVLQEGTNTVAVALYQDRDTSSDIYFDFETLDAVSMSAPISISDLVLNVGATEAERNVVWYTNLPTDGEVQWAPASAVSGEAFPEEGALTANPIESGASHDGRGYHHATMDQLDENTAYVYRVGSERGWSDTYSFVTGDFGADTFEFLMMGDPQLGSSGNVASDARGWYNTLDVAEDMFPDTDFIHSVGDQVEHAGAENQYDALLGHNRLKEVPFSTINGNHDVASTAYRTHFFMPGLDESYGGTSNPSHSGGNHWFIHNNMLVIGLNSNNMDVATHDAFVAKTLAEQGDKADWHVVSFHHSAFSVANHSTNSRIVEFRNAMAPMLSSHEIDMVMMGHDHSYTRTHLMDGRLPVPTQDSSELTPDVGQTLYVTGNSSSGSKYYGIRDAAQIGNADPNGFNYADVMWQGRVPSFSNIQVEGDTLTVTSYRTDTRESFDQVVLHRAGAEDEPVDPDPTDPDPGPTDPDPTDPETPAPGPGEGDLNPELEDLVSVDGDVVRGQPVSVTVGSPYEGQSVSGALFSEPLSLGTAVVANGTASLLVPADAPLGAHRLAIYNADSELVGWTEVWVVAAVHDTDPAADADQIPVTGELSLTGAGGFGMAVLALGLIGLGGAAVVVARRRHGLAHHTVA